MLWFFVADLARRPAFYTPGALGSALFFGARGTDEVRITVETVLGYTGASRGAVPGGGSRAGRAGGGRAAAPAVPARDRARPVHAAGAVHGLIAALMSWMLGAVSWWSYRRGQCGRRPGDGRGRGGGAGARNAEEPGDRAGGGIGGAGRAVSRRGERARAGRGRGTRRSRPAQRRSWTTWDCRTFTGNPDIPIAGSSMVPVSTPSSRALDEHAARRSQSVTACWCRRCSGGPRRPGSCPTPAVSLRSSSQ